MLLGLNPLRYIYFSAPELSRFHHRRLLGYEILAREQRLLPLLLLSGPSPLREVFIFFSPVEGYGYSRSGSLHQDPSGALWLYQMTPAFCLRLNNIWCSVQ